MVADTLRLLLLELSKESFDGVINQEIWYCEELLFMADTQLLMLRASEKKHQLAQASLGTKAN